MARRFERFIQERKYPRKQFSGTSRAYVGSQSSNDLQDSVLRMRETGLKASSCNCRIRSVNAYLRWTGSALHVPNRERRGIRPGHVLSEASRQLCALETSRIPRAPERNLESTGRTGLRSHFSNVTLPDGCLATCKSHWSSWEQ